MCIYKRCKKVNTQIIQNVKWRVIYLLLHKDYSIVIKRGAAVVKFQQRIQHIQIFLIWYNMTHNSENPFTRISILRLQ